jgi:hypothetical protein
VEKKRGKKKKELRKTNDPSDIVRYLRFGIRERISPSLNESGGIDGVNPAAEN